jgi:hypothetical protein
LAKSRFPSDTSREQNLDFIALLETCKNDFSPTTLSNLSGGRNFVWHWTTPHGRSGGILLGVDIDTMDIGSIDDGDFFVKFRLRDRKSDFKWVLVAVNGAAQPEFKESFLAALVRSYRNEKLPLCIGGDFNIMRNSLEKNNDKFDERWPFFFNAVIDSLDLREIEMSNLKQSISERLAQILREEELKWFQRAKTIKILKGDDNAKYFQMVANGKRMKTRIKDSSKKRGRSNCSSISQITTRVSLVVQREIISR